MANPRRNSYSSPINHQISISLENNNNTFQAQTLTTATLSSFKKFLKKPHAFPFLLSIFLFLTWVFLRLQRSSQFSQQHQQKWKGSESLDEDRKANLLRFPASAFPSSITKDKRGWLLDPLSIAFHSGITGRIEHGPERIVYCVLHTRSEN
ncbi:unnamed protein product [Ilex paraguariensis]|uniref:Uncharacterized protein n=1 Tax=Ilex paraguariensis TaxID=185542 RepID=A0ABC8RYY7_9AQUA